MGQASLRLFCLPHSGASATLYARWRRSLPPWVTVRPVELPGRGARLAEPLRHDPHVLVADLAGELVPEAAEGPYAFFGHSLGAVLAFELVHALSERGVPAPLAIFASGTEAPAVRDDSNLAEPFDDAALMADLQRLQGTSEEVLAAPELMAMVLPVLRADYLLCGNYRYRERPQLTCPIHVLGGTEDDVARDGLEAWAQEGAAGGSFRLFEGGHFYLQTRQEEVLAHVGACLSTVFDAGTRPARAGLAG